MVVVVIEQPPGDRSVWRDQTPWVRHRIVQFPWVRCRANALYRIVQEALTNACQHSQSKKVKVALTQQGREVQLEVRDWGTGFEPAGEKEHFGLEAIRQRVRLLSGRLTIESVPGGGALVRVVVPIVKVK